MEDWKAKVREKALVIADKAKEKAVEVSEKAAVVSETARVRLEKELEEARTARAETLSALYQELDVLRATAESGTLDGLVEGEGGDSAATAPRRRRRARAR